MKGLKGLTLLVSNETETGGCGGSRELLPSGVFRHVRLFLNHETRIGEGEFKITVSPIG